MADKKSKAKGAKAPKGKSKKAAADGGSAGPGGSSAGLSLAGHPRAVRGVARAKAWGGLGGFLVAGYLSLPTQTLAGAGLRALAAGVVCYVAVWAAAVFLWRRLVVAELRAAQHEALAVEVAKLSGGRPPGPGGLGSAAPAVPERSRARASV